jgi:hypothetical protein
MSVPADRLFLGLFLFSALISGCLKTNESASQGQDISQSDGTGVRMALLSLSADQFPEIDFATFMGHGALGAPQINPTVQLPGRVLEIFSPILNVEVYPLNGSTLRHETLNIQSGFAHSRVIQNGKSLIFGTQLTEGGKIEIVRNYKDSSAAAHALPFNVMHLPLNAENALALSEGTYVGIPIEGTAALNVNGLFLAKNGAFDSRLHEFLRAGGSGTLSGSMQGALIATGRWHLQILRLNDKKIRVRVIENDQTTASGGVSVSGQSVANFTFVPLGVMARALDLSQRVINKSRQGVQFVSDLQKYLKVPVLALPQPLQRAKEMASVLPTVDNETGRRLDEGIRLTDRAIDLANKGSRALQDAIDRTVGQQLQNITLNLTKKLDLPDKILQHLTHFTYNSSLAFQLNSEFGRKHRFLADYVFDLSTPEAQLAFEHAVSGRSIWLDEKLQSTQRSAGLNNFVVAERLAAEDSGRATPRVLRNSIGESTHHSRSLSVLFSGVMASTGFSEQWKKNTVWARDASGQTQSWQAALWQFERRMTALRSRESEQVGSGILAPSGPDAGPSDVGAYWFIWKRQLPTSRSGGMQSIFSEALNYVGPLGFAYGLPSYFKGEFEGDKEASLLVLLSKKATRAFFDPAQVTDDTLWKALGNVAGTFDNTFGLPFNTFGDLPPRYGQSAEARAACDVVGKNWGRGYCAFFGNEFLPRVAAARQSSDAWQKMKVFESFYTKGFLANKIGARLLVRYLTEVATLVFGKNVAQEVTLHFAIQNAQDSSAYASPSFQSGAPDELQVLKTLGMML